MEHSVSFLKKYLILLSLVLFTGTAMGDDAGGGADIEQAECTEHINIASYRWSQYIHRATVAGKHGMVAKEGRFLQGHNRRRMTVGAGTSYHLRYSFQAPEGSWQDKVYGAPYQGIGLSFNTFYNYREMGSPWALYMLQGGRLFNILPRLSMSYEWNFGLSWGWEPYDPVSNPYNISVGSRLNAYLDVDFYLNWALTDNIDMFAGVSFTHYSNGNTKLPNNGINLMSGVAGITYAFGRNSNSLRCGMVNVEPFHRHMVYEVLVFKSIKRRGIIGYSYNEVPRNSRPFDVMGISVSPMYALGYRFKAGASVDFVYDESADAQIKYNGEYLLPDFYKQLSLGLAAKIDYDMPYFTLSASVGCEIIHVDDQYKRLYQVLALKINVTKDFFLNMGYRVKNFQTPNFLMFGVGYRFNN